VTSINAALVGTVETQTFTGFNITKQVITLASTEYTHNLPAGTKGFQIQNRDEGRIFLRKTSGGDYWTFFPGTPWFPINIKGTASISLILSSDKANQTVEILYWN